MANNGNGKGIHFNWGSVLTTIVAALIAFMATWGAIGTKVERNITDIIKLQDTVAQLAVASRENVATVAALSALVERNTTANEKLREAWNNYVASANSDQAALRERLARIEEKLDALLVASKN